MPKPKQARPQPSHELRNDAIEKVTVLVTSALGLVAALAWNSAIQKLFATIFGTQSSIEAMFTYAITVTVIAIVVVIYLTRAMSRLKS